MNRYECDKCDWQYDWWRMRDRVKAVRRHELAHLVDQPAQPDSRMEVHASLLVKYLDERLKNMELVQKKGRSVNRTERRPLPYRAGQPWATRTDHV